MVQPLAEMPKPRPPGPAPRAAPAGGADPAALRPDRPARRSAARDRRRRRVAQRFLQREDLRLFASRTGRLVAEGHDDDRGNGLLVRDEVVHDVVGHAGLRPAALVVVGAMQQVHHRIFLAAGVVVGRRVDDHAAGDLVLLVEVLVLDQVAVWHVAEHHEVRFLPGQGDDALVDAGRRTNEGVLRVGRRQSVHDEPVLVVAGRELRGRERPDAIGVLGHVETGGAVDRGVAKLGHVGKHAHLLGVGCLQPEGDGVVRIDLGGAGIGDNTGLDTRPAPAARAAAPGGLLLIWAWTEAATSVASAVAERTRKIRFIVCSSASRCGVAHRARETVGQGCV